MERNFLVGLNGDDFFCGYAREQQPEFVIQEHVTADDNLLYIRAVEHFVICLIQPGDSLGRMVLILNLVHAENHVFIARLICHVFEDRGGCADILALGGKRVISDTVKFLVSLANLRHFLHRKKFRYIFPCLTDRPECCYGRYNVENVKHGVGDKRAGEIFGAFSDHH